MLAAINNAQERSWILAWNVRKSYEKVNSLKYTGQEQNKNSMRKQDNLQ